MAVGFQHAYYTFIRISFFSTCVYLLICTQECNFGFQIAGVLTPSTHTHTHSLSWSKAFKTGRKPNLADSLCHTLFSASRFPPPINLSLRHIFLLFFLEIVLVSSPPVPDMSAVFFKLFPREDRHRTWIISTALSCRERQREGFRTPQVTPHPSSSSVAFSQWIENFQSNLIFFIFIVCFFQFNALIV